MKKTGANVIKVKKNTEIVIILTVFVMFWEVNVKKSRQKTLFSQILALLSKSVCFCFCFYLSCRLDLGNYWVFGDET